MFELLNQGGWVMYVIFAASIAALALILERALYFYRTSVPYHLFSDRLRSESETVCVSEALPDSGTSSNYLENIAAVYRANINKDRVLLEEIVVKTGDMSIRKMESGISVISMIAVMAPLMGLFGTVLGMIDCFRKMQAVGGAADMTVLAGGIWEALLTTAFGLLVAMPATAAAHFFEKAIDRRQEDMRHLIADLDAVYANREEEK